MLRNCCPRCGSKRFHTVQETDSQTIGKNYSAGQGCLGFLLLGPLGLLCGMCGQNQRTVTTHKYFMICDECGHKFESPAQLREKISKAEELTPGKAIAAVSIISVLVAFVVGILLEDMEIAIGAAVACAIVLGIIVAVSFAIGKSNIEKWTAELRTLEAQMRRFQTEDGTPNVKLNAGDWKCACGRVNKSYTSTCSCGKSKHQSEGGGRWECSNCKHLNPPVAETCTRCGTRKTKVEEASPTENKQFIFCSECGDKNPREAKFCSGCGSPLHKN